MTSPYRRRPDRIPPRRGQSLNDRLLGHATATAEGLKRVAAALGERGGLEAMQLRVAEDYLTQFGNLAKAGNTLVVPANLSDVAGMISVATKVFEQSRGSAAPTGRST